MTGKEFQKSVVIVMTTFNRKAVTELCLRNLYNTKGAATLWVYDDYSTEMTLEDLKAIAPGAEIKRAPRKLYIDALRKYVHHEAKAAGFKYIYHVDNDAYHDPKWFGRLMQLHRVHDGLIGLYNSPFHQWYKVEDRGDYEIRKECPGVSFFYEIAKLPAILPNRGGSWDFVFAAGLGNCAISKTSFVEHLGAGGIHNKDFDRDRAQNPTPWLKTERERLIALLTKKD